LKPEFGMIHGRFQPFHNGHLEYLRAARELCDTLIIGITNPDPTLIAKEPASEHRHLPDANPFTYLERLLMIRAVVLDEAIPLEKVIVVPFPVNYPETWAHYVPRGVVHYVRVFSQWEQAKVDRLREYGYRAEILHPGAIKQVEASEIRRRMSAGEDWRPLVPNAVARVIERLRSQAALNQ